MLKAPTRVALLGSVAGFVLAGAAQAQQVAPADAQVDASPEACVILAERLAAEADIDAAVRTEVEGFIAEGDYAQCQVVITSWEQEGVLTADTLQVVARAVATERMIVQQEVEVAAEAAVYQPPAEVTVEADDAEILWTLPRQTVTVEEQGPTITVRQARPQISVEVPQPRVTVMMPEPEITVTWPEATLDMAQIEPMIDVRIPEPRVTVEVPEPVVEVMIGGAEPTGLVALEDGRFAPAGTTVQDLDPRVAVRQQQFTISPTAEIEAPEIVINRGDPIVTFEGQEPEVTVQVIGEPQIELTTAPGATDVRLNGAAPVEQEGVQPQQPQEGVQQQQPELQQQPGVQPAQD
jgi:hypothetical protein